MAKSGICAVEGCEQASWAKGLCNTHYSRLRRRGTLEPSDWGSRTKHPLYTIYVTRRKKGHLCEAWAKDFWQFATDVGERPSGDHDLKTIEKSDPLGPSNFFWMETVPDRNATEYHREWRGRNSDKVKEYILQRQYGMSLAEFHERIETQGNLCAICGEEMKTPHIDHDHATGAIRDLLCGPCNIGLGNFKDDPTLLTKGIEYLNTHNE